MDAARDWVRVIGTPVLWSIACARLAAWPERNFLTRNFIANLTPSNGKNHTMFQTQTIPIQPPEIGAMAVKPEHKKGQRVTSERNSEDSPQSANAAMIEETS